MERSKSLKKSGSIKVKVPKSAFWEKDGYKVDVDRITDNVHQLDLLNKFFIERAELEADYARKLRQHKQKYQVYFSKSSMYGSHQQACMDVLEQSEPLAVIHEQISKLLHNDCSARVG